MVMGAFNCLNKEAVLDKEERYQHLTTTESYKNLVSYMRDIGYTKQQAEKEIKKYAMSDDFVNLDDFVNNYLPLLPKIKGKARGKKFVNPNKRVNSFMKLKFTSRMR